MTTTTDSTDPTGSGAKDQATVLNWKPTKLRETPSWLLIQAANLTNRFVSIAYERTGSTRHQYVMLTALGEMEATTQADLGRHCHIDRSDVTGTIGELEAAGYITREENAADRRQKIVSLTPAGRERLAIIAAALHEAQDELLEGMSETEKTTLSTLLVGILDRHSGRFGSM